MGGRILASPIEMVSHPYNSATAQPVIIIVYCQTRFGMGQLHCYQIQSITITWYFWWKLRI